MVLPVRQHVGLAAEHLGDRVRVICLCNAQRGRPVLLVDVHVDGLLGLAAFDELDLRLGEAALVLQEHGELDVNLGHLGGRVGPAAHGTHQISAVSRDIWPAQVGQLVSFARFAKRAQGQSRSLPPSLSLTLSARKPAGRTPTRWRTKPPDPRGPSWPGTSCPPLHRVPWRARMQPLAQERQGHISSREASRRGRDTSAAERQAGRAVTRSHLLGRVASSIGLGDPDGILPHLGTPVHVYRRFPFPGFHVVLLGVLEAPLGLELLGHVQVGLQQQLLWAEGGGGSSQQQGWQRRQQSEAEAGSGSGIGNRSKRSRQAPPSRGRLAPNPPLECPARLAVLSDQSDHVVVALVLLVHVDCQVVLANRHVQPVPCHRKRKRGG